MTASTVNGAGTRIMTAGELAERWQVTEGHVYALTRSGQIPCVKLGRYYRYRLDAIEAFELGGTGDPRPAKRPGSR